MKRFVVLTTLLVFAFSLSALAQEKVAKKLEFGIQAGLCMGNVSGDSAKAGPGETKKARMGFGGGAFATFKLSPQFGIQPELLYLQKGVKYEEGSAKMTVKADYIEVPVYLAFLPKLEGKIQPSIFAGPYIGYLMSAKIKTEGMADPADNGEEDVKDSTKTTDFGISFGAGFGYALNPKGELFVNVRYDLGMTKVDDHAEQQDSKLNMFAVMLGYRFK
jgi:hypothetical protein